MISIESMKAREKKKRKKKVIKQKKADPITQILSYAL